MLQASFTVSFQIPVACKTCPKCKNNVRAFKPKTEKGTVAGFVLKRKMLSLH